MARHHSQCSNLLGHRDPFLRAEQKTHQRPLVTAFTPYALGCSALGHSYYGIPSDV